MTQAQPSDEIEDNNRITDVLLAALSDTLNENPDVMEKARRALNKK